MELVVRFRWNRRDRSYSRLVTISINSRESKPCPKNLGSSPLSSEEQGRASSCHVTALSLPTILLRAYNLYFRAGSWRL